MHPEYKRGHSSSKDEALFQGAELGNLVGIQGLDAAFPSVSELDPARGVSLEKSLNLA
jgi:hypothetical protein